ncbi:hypothetical protein BN000_02647 [Neobacillus massiliamazoniensis]|jgi:hypothetical protein|uniref:Uncharacterized protein n=1 Tax=Neobacillus massiliamazoniensis TaxID=1499688 RepID=A0A0U1NXG3_9BACI|nr:hypothetical protein BN000_02647 [Neobacillus massiliamazoniensis]
MRYEIVDIKNKETKVNIRCRDSKEQVFLKISLSPNTLECTDKFIPDSLQRFLELNHDSIQRYLNHLNDIQNDTKTCAG